METPYFNSRRKAILWSAAIFLAALLFCWWSAGTVLSSPVNHRIALPPSDLGVVQVEFSGIKGWFIPAHDRNNCVVLMHGVRADRTSMLDRARFLKKAGFSSLLFDFQAHGESPGEKITFGFLESKNAYAAVAFLKTALGCRRIGAIGQSLGGAASLLGDQPLPVEALVLESVYPTIEEAVANRMAIYMGNAGRFVAPLLTTQIPLRQHIPLSALRPVDAIKKLTSPVLLIAGSADEHTSLSESQRLFTNAPNPKTFWVVNGAKHVDLYQYTPQQYEQNIISFFNKYLVSDA